MKIKPVFYDKEPDDDFLLLPTLVFNLMITVNNTNWFGFGIKFGFWAVALTFEWSRK